MSSSYGFLAVAVGLSLIGLGYGCGFVTFWLFTRAQKTDKTILTFTQKASFTLIYGGMFFVFLGFLYLMGITRWSPDFSALFVGLVLIAVGCFFLMAYLPFVAEKWEASISIFAQKASFALIIGGLILTILFFLNSMNLIPWWSSA